MHGLHKLIDSRVSQSRESNDPVTKIVFHCMYSQQRGPRMAGAYQAYLQEEQQNDEWVSSVQLCILQGGFHGWFNAAKQGTLTTTAGSSTMDSLVANYDETLWVRTSKSGFLHVDDNPGEHSNIKVKGWN